MSIGKGLKIPYASGALWVGKQGRLETKYDKPSERWYVHQPVKVEWEARHHHQRHPRLKRASIDIGVCNLITAVIEGKEPNIYSGRAVLSDWVILDEEDSKRTVKADVTER